MCYLVFSLHIVYDMIRTRIIQCWTDSCVKVIRAGTGRKHVEGFFFHDLPSLGKVDVPL